LMASVRHLVFRVKPSSITIPLFLCSLLRPYESLSLGRSRNAQLSRPQKRKLYIETVIPPAQSLSVQGLPTPSQLLELPRSCPGCGALTQTISSDQPGFYSTNRKSVRAFIARNGQPVCRGHTGESETFDHVIGTADASLLAHLGLTGPKASEKGTETLLPPKIAY